MIEGWTHNDTISSLSFYGELRSGYLKVEVVGDEVTSFTLLFFVPFSNNCSDMTIGFDSAFFSWSFLNFSSFFFESSYSLGELVNMEAFEEG